MTLDTDDDALRRAREELVVLRARVDCRAVLEAAGWDLDARESSRRAIKYRGGPGRIVIVTHGGKGWFDPLVGKKGDALALAQHVWTCNLGHARKKLRPLAGVMPTSISTARSREQVPLDGKGGWASARDLSNRSEAWRYLTLTRALPAATVERAILDGVLKEGVRGTVLAVHRDGDGCPTGWEMRGPDYKGFSAGGSKALFVIGDWAAANRLAATESAIDALSLATLEGWPTGTLYASTAGGFGPKTSAVLMMLLKSSKELVAATDQGTGGDLLAGRLRELAETAGVAFRRLCPTAKDWNDQLRATKRSDVG